MTDTQVKAIEDRREAIRRHPAWEQTVASVVSWCAQQGLDAHKVTITSSGELRWVSMETDGEHAQRLDYERRAAERQEQQDRETYERLRTKFDGGTE